jgi:hypothetical protein
MTGRPRRIPVGGTSSHRPSSLPEALPCPILSPTPPRFRLPRRPCSSCRPYRPPNDGTEVPARAGERSDGSGRRLDLWWSGKHTAHGGNVQVITVPRRLVDLDLRRAARRRTRAPAWSVRSIALSGRLAVSPDLGRGTDRSSLSIGRRAVSKQPADHLGVDHQALDRRDPHVPARASERGVHSSSDTSSFTGSSAVSDGRGRQRAFSSGHTCVLGCSS